jgi:hypothetical protein
MSIFSDVKQETHLLVLSFMANMWTVQTEGGRTTVKKLMDFLCPTHCNEEYREFSNLLKGIRRRGSKCSRYLLIERGVWQIKMEYMTALDKL